MLLLNIGRNPFTVERGMRIAPAVLAPVTRAAWEQVTSLKEMHRGAGGFGISG